MENYFNFFLKKILFFLVKIIKGRLLKVLFEIDIFLNFQQDITFSHISNIILSESYKGSGYDFFFHCEHHKMSITVIFRALLIVFAFVNIFEIISH